jgi:hypothetical protein
MATATARRPKVDLDDAVIVLRGNFDADGIARQRGEVLSGKIFRDSYRIQALVNTHYLDHAKYDLGETIVGCECGRKWETAAFADTHNCPAREAAGEEV